MGKVVKYKQGQRKSKSKWQKKPRNIAIHLREPGKTETGEHMYED